MEFKLYATATLLQITMAGFRVGEELRKGEREKWTIGMNRSERMRGEGRDKRRYGIPLYFLCYSLTTLTVCRVQVFIYTGWRACSAE